MYIKYSFLVIVAFMLFIICTYSESKPCLLYGIANSKYYVELAKIHQKYGFYNEAVEMYKKAIDAEPVEEEKQKYLIGLSRLYFQSEQFKEAEATALQAIGLEKGTERKAEYSLYLRG